MSRSSSTDMQELKEQLNNSLYDNVFYPAETDLLDGGNLIATDVYCKYDLKYLQFSTFSVYHQGEKQ